MVTRIRKLETRELLKLSKDTVLIICAIVIWGFDAILHNFDWILYKCLRALHWFGDLPGLTLTIYGGL